MRKKNIKRIRAHYLYKFKKNFYRKFGRKPYILLTKEQRKKYRKIRKKAKLKMIQESKIITLPSILSLSSEYRTEFLNTMKEINTYLPSKKYKCSIDHSYIEKITPEALIVLAADIKRCVRKNKVLKFNSKYAPQNEQVMRMLNSIGYWEHFNISKNDLYTDKKRRYLKIIHDTQADNMHVVELREFFDKKLDFLDDNDDDAEQMFDDAISEAIANSVEHAYIKEQARIIINKAWWLSGSYDTTTNELFFMCYDQGIGVKDALSHHDNRKVKKWVSKLELLLKNDSDVIETLVKEDLPKYKDTDRGHGFKHFIKFIENYTHGSLSIYSKKGVCKFIKENDSILTQKDEFKDSLDGTLIVWKIKFDRSVTKC